LKAVRLAVLNFLPHFVGRNILLHDDNHAVCHVMAGLISRSPEMINDLRRLWFVDNNNIHIEPRCIRSAANTWADKLSRHLDSDDWQIHRTIFHKMDSLYGPHTIDRFASALNTLLPG
jgi:hypothetical protein